MGLRVQIIHETASVTSRCLGNSRDNQRIFRVCSSSAWRQLPTKMLLRYLVILLPVLPPWSLNEGLGFLQKLLDQLDKDTDPHCQVKALYAVSCLVRESKE